MRILRSILIAGMVIASTTVAFSQGSVLVVDRGLPTANLNNAAGSNRSNVAWSFGAGYYTGDDFVIGSTGQKWLITKVRGWSTQGAPGGLELGDRFQSVTLNGGEVDAVHLPLTSGNFLYGAPLSPIATGNLSLGSSSNSNPNITHTRVQYAGGADYQGYSGSYIQIWQHDILTSWLVDGGKRYAVAADGVLQTGADYNWFNHASNAALSGSPQDGADGLYLGWDKSDPGWMFVCDSSDAFTCGGWDKSSDLNIQVWAKRVANDKDLCKNNGWKTLFRANGSPFKNQGDCIQYVNTGR